jgi:hypothetical protein
MGSFPATHARVLEHQRQRMSDIESLLRAGIDAGAFRGFHPRVLAEMLFATIGRLTDPQVMPTLGLSIYRAFEEAYGIFEEGIFASRSRAPTVSRAGREHFRSELRSIWPTDDGDSKLRKGSRRDEI